MYGSHKDIMHNLKMFFIDGITYMPSMALLSISAVIPYFLSQLGATTFQIALATAITLVGALLTQPVFGVIASRSVIMNKTFGKILLLQRLLFFVFVLLIPVFAGANAVLINLFLIFWSVFNLFVGSYSIFFTPIIVKLLPPDKRGGTRGVGLAIGSFLGVGMSALIPLILSRIAFPYSYMVIFSLGLLFLFVNAVVFLLMRQSKETVPNEPMDTKKYLTQMPATLLESPAFRALILTCISLAIANSLLTYYTLYAIRVFSASEAHIAAFAGLAVLSGAVAYVIFGFVIDRRGPRLVMIIVAFLITAAGALALTTDSLGLLFVAWALANIGFSGYYFSATLLMGEISPTAKLPLYMGVFSTITMAISAVVVLLLAPVLENMGFSLLFIIVLACGLLSLLINVFVLRKRMAELQSP